MKDLLSGNLACRIATACEPKESPPTFRRNVLLILHGLYDVPWKALVSVYSAEEVERLYDCDGCYLPEPENDSERWLAGVLKLAETRPDDVAIRLRDTFGPQNVFIVPARGFLASRLITGGISAIVSVDCDELP